MNHFSNTVLWVYIVLLLIGGLIGFLKAKIKVSLISSSIFAALLVLTAIPGLFQVRVALGLAGDDGHLRGCGILSRAGGDAGDKQDAGYG